MNGFHIARAFAERATYRTPGEYQFSVRDPKGEEQTWSLRSVPVSCIFERLIAGPCL